MRVFSFDWARGAQRRYVQAVAQKYGAQRFHASDDPKMASGAQNLRPTVIVP